MFTYADQDDSANRATVRIVTHWSNGSFNEASGAMVGPNDVLTAAHVVHEAGLTLTGIDILPAFHAPDESDGLYHPETEGQTPFGRYCTGNINDVHIYSFSDSTAANRTDEESSSDLALITLPVNLGNQTGWFGLRANAPEG